MTSKGERYSKVFRKAGIALGKGEMHKAITILQEGLRVASACGDTDVARVLQADLERYQRIAAGAAIAFTAAVSGEAPLVRSRRLGVTQRGRRA